MQPTSMALPAQTARAFRFTATASGSSSQANVYIDGYQNRASTLHVGLYSDDNGTLGSLLASGSTTSVTPNAWTSVAISTVQITQGQNYWLAILGSGGQLGYRDSYGGCTTSRQIALANLPTAWVGTSSGSACASVYVGGTASPPPPPPNPVPPSNTNPPTIGGSPQQGGTLTANPGSWSGDTPMTFTYAWSDGSTGRTDILSSADVGNTITVTVTASNDAGTATATSQPVGPVQSAPAVTAPSNTSLPTISGTAQQGDTLTALPGVWGGTAPISYTYLWSDGTTGSTDLLSAGDVGQSVSVTVTATNGAGSAHATSASVGPIAAAPPPPPPPPPPSGFQSVLFWLGWDGGNYTTIPWSAVTQVDMFSLASCVSAGNPAADCTGPTGISSQFNSVSNPTAFTSTVHQHGRQAIITIGGSTNPNWYYSCNPSDAAGFAQNLVNYMQSNGFDGIDLDIEQDANTGNPQFTAADLLACTQDVYNDAKAVKTAQGGVPLVTSDVDPTTNFDIGKIQGPYVDQFNAMSYGATGSQLATWITNLHNNSNIPYSKITAGIDVTGNHDCPGTASYASSNGLAGTMVWFGQADANNGYACLNAIAPDVG